MTSLAFDGTQRATPVGHFSYIVADDHWVWSTGLYELHGYTPNEVEPTSELMLKHKHPDDAARTLDVLETVISTAAPFACYHRIVDKQGRIRPVLSVGRGLRGGQSRVEEVTGFFVDLTEIRRSETQLEVDVALVQIAKTRSVIDQAKGIVMAAARCDADQAFDILRQSSSHRNLKLRELSLRLVQSVIRRPDHEDGDAVRGDAVVQLADLGPAAGDPLAGLMMTAHV